MCDRDLYRVYQITCLACHARLCFLRAFLLRALPVLLAFIFWCALQAPIFYVSYVLWFFTCPHFFMCLAWPHLLTCLQAFIFYLPFFFAYLRAFFTCSTCILFTCFRFSCILQIFYLPLFLLSALSFSLTLLFFIFLHALRCLNFSSQMSNKGGKGDIDFFIFLDPFRGNKDLFRVFQLRNYFFFRYYVFFQVDNKHLDGNIFLTLVITSRGLPYFEKICMHWN